VWLPDADGEKNLKICLFIWTECTNVMVSRNYTSHFPGVAHWASLYERDRHRMTLRPRMHIIGQQNGNKTAKINIKNFHGSLTTVVRAQNDTSKTANITDTIFDRTCGYIALTSDGVLKIGEIRRSVSC